MDGIKHSGRFAEMERLVNDYFNCHIAPIMSKTRTDLIRNQGEEMKEYSTSLGGILSMMASSAQPMSDPYQALKVTGEWNSKTTEDYIEMWHVTMSCQNCSVVTSPMPIWTTG